MIRRVVQYPDLRLRKVADPIEKLTPAIRTIARDMLDTMVKFGGAGLSACQVGENIAMVTIAKEMGTPWQILINPKIVALDLAPITSVEGCLSIESGTLQYNVIRRGLAMFEATDMKGNTHRFKAQKGLCRVILHEIDHLHGLTIADHGMICEKQDKSPPPPEISNVLGRA